MNVAEVIPYKNYKEKFKIVFQELLKNRYVEVWDNYIYSAKKWEVKQWEKNAERVFLTQKKKVAKYLQKESTTVTHGLMKKNIKDVKMK